MLACATSSSGDLPQAALAALLKAGADPLRLQILGVLSGESFGVSELCEILDVAQPALSHHLKVLNQAGLIEPRREGNSIFYRRALIDRTDPWAALRTSLYDTVTRLRLSERIKAGQRRVHEDRAVRSRGYFERNARDFRDNQKLIVEYAQYAGGLADLLNNEPLADNARALEVGPGTGELLADLADRYTNLTGLDNVAGMLEQARARLPQHTRIRLLHGEMKDLLHQGEAHSFDLVVMAMVLHHMPSPAEVFRDVAELLSDRGRFLLVELSSHDQDWARDICGDLWLGFDGHDLDTWAAVAGLAPGQRLHMGLRNGFQVQMRLFEPTNPGGPTADSDRKTRSSPTAEETGNVLQ